MQCLEGLRGSSGTAHRHGGLSLHCRTRQDMLVCPTNMSCLLLHCPRGSAATSRRSSRQSLPYAHRAAGPLLPAAQLAALQPDLLARLDDSSNAVRAAACTALQAWLACMLAPAGGISLAEADASALASSMLIHLDDADVEVAEAVGRTLCTLASARPTAVRSLARAAVAVQQQQRPDLLSRVLAACEGGGCST